MTQRLLAMFALAAFSLTAETPRWDEAKAKAWYARQPWLVGANYIPSTAINELEMWQADSFDPKRIDQEFGWAQSIGMNTMRVFLHDLMWQQDPKAFVKRIDAFLKIADKHGIRPMLVLFDSCWDPYPTLGKQREPKPGVHNSGWVQSPGIKALQDPAEYGRLQAYATGVVKAFANDRRVLAWDIWNEPDNRNTSSYGPGEPATKISLVEKLLPQAFEWARAGHPTQPLTSGVWAGDWSDHAKLSPTARVQIDMSDVITFHNYSDPTNFEKALNSLKQYNRPILCTEYMARGVKSTFEGVMPIAAREKVAMINWGLVQGKTQTNLPWDSWKQPYVNGREPSIWFHEVFRNDGTPYKPEEVEFIKGITGKSKARKAA